MIKVKRTRAGEYTCFLHGEKLELLKRKGTVTGVFWVARKGDGTTVATDDLLSGLRAKLSKIPTLTLPEHKEDDSQHDEYRREYGAIMKRSGLDSKTFNTEVGKILKISNVQDATPAQFVEAAKQVTVPCAACSGTGVHRSGGKCYRCNGKGAQDDADRRRNYGYDARNHSAAE